MRLLLACGAALSARQRSQRPGPSRNRATSRQRSITPLAPLASAVPTQISKQTAGCRTRRPRHRRRTPPIKFRLAGDAGCPTPAPCPCSRAGAYTHYDTLPHYPVNNGRKWGQGFTTCRWQGGRLQPLSVTHCHNPAVMRWGSGNAGARPPAPSLPLVLGRLNAMLRAPGGGGEVGTGTTSWMSPICGAASACWQACDPSPPPCQPRANNPRPHAPTLPVHVDATRAGSTPSSTSFTC